MDDVIDPFLPSAAKFAVMQNAASFNDVIGCGPRMRETHEAARIHHAHRYRVSGIAIRCASAAAQTAHRRAYVDWSRTIRKGGSRLGIPGGAAGNGLGLEIAIVQWIRLRCSRPQAASGGQENGDAI